MKRCVRAQVQTANNRDDNTAHEMSPKGHIESAVDFAKVRGERDSTISGKTPAQATLPGVAGNPTADTRYHDKGLQSNGSPFVTDGLVEKS